MTYEIYQNNHPKLPTSIDLEPTIRCNYACKMCQRTYWNRKSPDMDFEQFKHIYDSFPCLEYIKIQGVGEPLLNTNVFEMIEYAKQNGSHVTTYTNGSLLHINNNAQKLLHSGIDLIRISVDGGTKQTFESIRVNSNFSQVIQNINLICKLGKGLSTPKIELWMIGYPDNITEIPEVIDIAKHAEIETVYIQMLVNTFEYKNEINNKLGKMRLTSTDKINFHLNSAMKYAISNNVQLKLFASKIYSADKPCHWPFDSIFISVEGYVVPCGTISDPSTIQLGNIFKQNILDIWESMDYKTFRQSILENNLSIPCKNCYSEENKKLLSNLITPWQCSSYPFVLR